MNNYNIRHQQHYHCRKGLPRYFKKYFITIKHLSGQDPEPSLLNLPNKIANNTAIFFEPNIYPQTLILDRAVNGQTQKK